MAAECRSLTPKRIPEGGCLELDDGCIIGLSGAGPRAAQACCAALAEKGATSLISWGCAAALAPGMNPGDLVLPTRIACTDGIQIATDAEWHARFSLLLNNHSHFADAGQWERGRPAREQAGYAGRLPTPRGKFLHGALPVYSGVLVESDRIIAREDEKSAIFAATGAIALDMESAAAARAADRFNLPFLAIRSIVDPVDVSIPPSIHNAFDENGVLNVPKMFFRSLLHPADFVGIIRLGRHFGAAMKTLGHVAAVGRENHFAGALKPQTLFPRPNPL